MKEAYTDRFEFSLDDKGRVSVPAEWRGEAFEKRFLVLPSEEGCLRVYPASFLGRQLEKLSAEGVTSTDVRRKMTSRIKELAEEARVAIRNVRRDANKASDSEKTDGTLTEDDCESTKEEVQELTKKYEAKVGDLARAKEAEVMEQ